MHHDVFEKLMLLGFSGYEAKAYVALLQHNPATGYQIAKESGIPRSMIYEVLSKLIARGAAMVLPKESGSKYSPVPAAEFLEKIQSQTEDTIKNLKKKLSILDTTSNLEYVWNIEGPRNIVAKAMDMISQAKNRIYLSLMPETFSELKSVLHKAISRKVKVVIYSTENLEMEGARVVYTPIPGRHRYQVQGLWLLLVKDGKEVLIGEWLGENKARASWTRSPLFVFVAEHHLRTDVYLPKVLKSLGDKARELIREEDWELFAHAYESHLDD